MTTIHSELYDALVAAGAPDDKARAAANTAVTIPSGETPATSRDIGEVKAEITELRAATSRDITRLEERFKRVENAITHLDGRLWRVAMVIVGLFGTQIFLLAKIAFFP